MFAKMNNEESYVDKLHAQIKENCDITRKGYSFARKHDKCLTKIENSKSALNTQIDKIHNQNVKRNTCSNSIDILKQMSSDTDLEIERVQSSIEYFNEKIGRVCNDILFTSRSLSYEDELKILQRILALMLQNNLKHSNEIQTIRTGFEAPRQNEAVSDQSWTQFRMN